MALETDGSTQVGEIEADPSVMLQVQLSKRTSKASTGELVCSTPLFAVQPPNNVT